MCNLLRAASRYRLASLIRRVPLVGEVQNHIIVTGADFHDRELGGSRAMPTVLEIKLDQHHRPPAGVGQIVKQTFFPDEPDFIFNVAFSCGDPGLFSRGVYSDPSSIWFNVFFGYYQLDVPRPAWNRPFGYSSADAGAPIETRDILRIGKADWNYFSNYVYGVPRDVIVPLDVVDPAAVQSRYLGRRRIGESYWDEIELDGVSVVSAYVAPGEEHRLVDHDPVLSPIWRLVFGLPHPRREVTTSFLPTSMLARLYMSYRAAEDVDLETQSYQTLIFGGTVRRDYQDLGARDRFLGLQLAAVRRVISSSYPRAGFASAEPLMAA